MHAARSRRTMLSAAAIVGVAIVLAACGSSAKKASTAAAPTSAASSSTSQAASSSTAISTASSPKGQILVNAQGKSLYVFDKDTAGKIACTTGCVAVWPPLVVPSGTSAPTGVMDVTATLGTVMRPEGTTQLTSDGRPLYSFSGDSGPGQVNGDGFMNIWHVAKVSGNGSPPAAAGTTPTTTPSSSSSGGYGY
jgi:predicted lipoprotein with Yx(FWY)xxD motif